MSRDIKYKAVMQRNDGVMYVSQPYSIDNSLSYLFDFENNRWDKFIEMITTEERFVELFPDDDEYLKGWTHNENIQYTGLKDKNGVEIYEGDILKYPYVRGSSVNYSIEIGAIEWSNDYCGFIIDEVQNIGGFCGIESKHMNELEVIGNIYENPELLN